MNDISLTQRMVSEDNNKHVIEVVVENNLDVMIENAKIISQNCELNFENVMSNSSKIESYKFFTPVRDDFDSNAKFPDSIIVPSLNLSYMIGGESFEVESNELVFVL